MRMPFKINRRFWPSLVARWLPATDDPRMLLDGELSGDDFTHAVSVFRFGRTFKTTARARFPQTVDALSVAEYKQPPLVLDIGASDGITSLHLISSLPFAKYYVTDLNTEVRYVRSGRDCYFYDRDENCILFASDKTVCYPPDADAIFPFGRLAKRIFAKAPAGTEVTNSIELINPEVMATGHDVEFCRYDVFTNWNKQPVDLVVVANILNRRYFSESQLCLAVKNIIAAINGGGRIAIIESRERERSTIFRVGSAGLTVEYEIGGGAEIRDLLLREFSPAKAA